jgi:hypothetical protein
VQLDVRRSLSHFGVSRDERRRLLPRLTTVIDSVLALHPELYYYQAAKYIDPFEWFACDSINFDMQEFNDVCSVVVYVRDTDPFPVCERLALYFFFARYRTAFCQPLLSLPHISALLLLPWFPLISYHYLPIMVFSPIPHSHALPLLAGVSGSVSVDRSP